MSILRVGSTQKFSENWGNIFGGRKSSSAEPKPAGKKKATAKVAKSAKAKKSPKKKVAAAPVPKKSPKKKAAAAKKEKSSARKGKAQKELF